MPGNTYFIPAKDAGFDAFFNNFCREVTQNTAGQSPARANIPADEAAALNASRAARRTGYVRG